VYEKELSRENPLRAFLGFPFSRLFSKILLLAQDDFAEYGRGKFRFRKGKRGEGSG
jgi:hypothetical protein